jgi:hypothetical protein
MPVNKDTGTSPYCPRLAALGLGKVAGALGTCPIPLFIIKKHKKMLTEWVNIFMLIVFDFPSIAPHYG